MKRLNLLQSTFWNLLLITTGSIIFAFGVKAILLQHSFLMGGLYGTGLLFFYITDLLSPGILFFLFNIPIMVIGYLLVSRRFFLYSLWAVIIVTLASEFIVFDLHIKNQLYAAVAGGVVCGVGSGIILRSIGSGGGLDIIAIILNQKFNFGIGKFFFLYNLCLFGFAVSVYDIDLIIASLIITFISSTTLESVLSLFNQRKVVYILSDYSKDIASAILVDLKQRATVICAKGAYSGKDKEILMTITNTLQVKRLEESVFNIDPDALFVVENTFNVIGAGLGKRKIY